ncbi:MAG: PKD domain-containing protein [Allomuricauda sp.]|jgi:PKD repeat protein
MRRYRRTKALIIIVFLVSCAKEVALPIKAQFEVAVESNDYSVPVRVAITNLTDGADTFQWTFEGGEPSSSTDKNPGTVRYNKPGSYTIDLEATNRDGNKETSQYQIQIDEAIVPKFQARIVDDNYLPVTVNIENMTKGADRYQWKFEKGIPSQSTEKSPQHIVFNEPGDHVIILEASNGRETQLVSDTITVTPDIYADFDYRVAFEDDDFEVPVILTLFNKSISATNFEWTFDTAVPASSLETNPTITINTPGVHQLKLKASNSKRSHTVIKEITVYEDTNLRSIDNVQLGISSAHNNNIAGAFYSTKARKVYTKDSVPLDDGSNIDMAFFALNQDFNFNKFVSPDEVEDYTFEPIPNAKHTKFINLQESCECEASLTVAEFDAMEDDSLLAVLNIEETIGGIQDFDNSMVPRIVLFETWDGRKGAIKIKEFVQDGTNSHIVVDVKMQKQ